MADTQSFDTVALNNLRLLEGAMVDILPLYLVALGDDPRVDPKPLLGLALVNVAKVLNVDADNDAINKLTGTPGVLAVWEKARSVWLTDDLITNGLIAHALTFDADAMGYDDHVNDYDHDDSYDRDDPPSYADRMMSEWGEDQIMDRTPAIKTFRRVPHVAPSPVFKGVNKRLIEKNNAGDPLFKVEVLFTGGPARTVYHAHTGGIIHNFPTLTEARRHLGIVHASKR